MVKAGMNDLQKCESPAVGRASELNEVKEQGASETPGLHETLRVAMVLEHLPIEAMPSSAVRRVAASTARQPRCSGANDGAPAVMDGDVEAKISAVHGQPPSAAGAGAAANGSTWRWIGWARPIQGSGRMQRTQSAKLG